jgi:hypothetical protein
MCDYDDDGIYAEHHDNFNKYDNNTIDTLGTEYDYGSIMHYKNNTFAENRNFITINATRSLPPGVEMGQRVALSETDIIKIHRLYRCSKRLNCSLVYLLTGVRITTRQLAKCEWNSGLANKNTNLLANLARIFSPLTYPFCIFVQFANLASVLKSYSHPLLTCSYLLTLMYLFSFI